MDARSLKTLLRTLQEFGVSSYRDADVTVQFGAAPAPLGGDVEGEMVLPPGTPDAAAIAAQIQRIRAEYEPKPRKERRPV